MNSNAIKALLVGTLALTVQLRDLLAYSASVKTQVSATDATGVNRLFLFNGQTNLAPIGSTIWFVADTASNGVPHNPTDPGSVLGVDDRLIWTDIVDGNQPGIFPGRYSQTLTNLDPNDALVPVFFYLWGNLQGSNAVPDFGSTYGLFSVGVVADPGFGAAQWPIINNVFGNTFTVVGAVPEPAALVLVGLGLVSVLGYRRFKR